MRILFSTLLLFFAIVAEAQTTVQSLMHNDVQRSYRVHLPPNFDATIPSSVILNFHGIGSNAIQQQFYSGFNTIADTANFIVVYPDGLVDTLADGGIISHWNCYFGSDSDDVGFTNALIDTLYEDYNIDLSRVYATGMSNGGFMSYMLACELSHRIAAIASVTGAFSFPQENNCNSLYPIPVMQIHGTDDETVPYDGSDFYYSAPDAVNYWVTHNNCDSEPETQEIPNTDTGDDSTASLEIYGGCDETSEVQFYTVNSGTHTWPGAFNFVGSVTNQDFNASSVIWNFFNRFQHPNPCPEVNACHGVNLEAKILLEGPYSESGTMENDLNALLPLTQPYNIAPYNYEGTETLNEVPTNAIDWILVEMRSGTPSLTTQNTLVAETKVGLLLETGDIVDVDGVSPLSFDNLSSGESYHICIRHRNHLDVLSSEAIIANNDVSYDFTTAVDKTFGEEQLKELEEGVFGLFASDFNTDGLIQVTDYDLWFANPAAVDVYSPVDVNLDGIIQVTDYDLWFANKAKVGTPEVQF